MPAAFAYLMLFDLGSNSTCLAQRAAAEIARFLANLSMHPMPNRLRLPERHEVLNSRIEQFSSAARPGRLSLALQVGGDPVFLDYRGSGTLQIIENARTPLVPACCLTKPLTASLLAEAVGVGRLEWAARINDVLEVSGAAGDKLAGITFSHLLSHTHGLDASAITVVPRDSHGFIDALALGEQLPITPLSDPGEMYSYSNAGAWLAGAALERLTDTPFAQLLSESSCALPSDVTRAGLPSPLCPATGGSLALTAAQWLSFANRHTNAVSLSLDPIERSLALLRASQVSMPGWSLSEQAACLGWKYYGEGWFGHTANLGTSIVFLRFNPIQSTQIVMWATSEIAPFGFSCLLRDYCPELKNLSFPRLLTRAESDALRLEMYVGTYAQAKTQIAIDRTDHGHLSCAIISDDSAQCSPPQVLQAADNDIFFPTGKRNAALPFIQFLRSPDCKSFDRLWNGNHLWRRR